MFAQIDNRDWSALASLFCDDLVYERPGYAAFAGRERVLQFYRHERIIACGNHVLDRVIFSNDRGASWGRFTGTAKDGSALDIRFAEVYEVERERLKRRTTYFFSPGV